MTVPQSFDLWCRELVYLKNRSPRTIRSYRQAFSSLQQSLGAGAPTSETDAVLVSKAQLQAWVVSMREKGMSPGGCNAYIRAVNAFTSWLNTQEGISVPRLPLLKTATGRLAALDDAGLRRLLAFQPRTHSERRVDVLVKTLLDSGCRVDEVVKLAVRDLDMDNLLLTVQGKGDKERRIPFSPELRKVLFRYGQFKDKRGIHSDFLFPAGRGSLSYRNAVRDFKKLKSRVGLPAELGFHQLRHSFATGYLRNGGDVVRLSKQLGHSSVTVTMRYVHLMTEDLREAHQKLSPLARLRA